MPSIFLDGVTVQFPFTPYDCQKKYMEKVIKCLKEKLNGVLESPTGTGKTLCLLCATLAWREHFKDTISAQKISERLEGKEMFTNKSLEFWGSASEAGSTAVSYSDVPQIIYASRTHSQLTQVVNELKNTSYKPKVSVLGSREQLCINPEVRRQESNHVKVHMCRAKVSTRSCVFYNNVEEKSTDRVLVESIVDMEDLVKFGNKQRACPYYLSRSLKQQADVVFAPYNYLLDPRTRKAHSIDLAGSVVILDEAHNVEKTCEEATSFDITPYDLASAIDALTRLLSEHVQQASLGEASSSGLNPEAVANLKEIVLKLEEAIDSYEVQDDKGITKPGIFIYELLERASLTYKTKDTVFEALEQIVGFFAGQPGLFTNTGGLQKLMDMLQLVFCGEASQKELQQKMEANTASFKVHIHKDTSAQKKQKNGDPWGSSTKKTGNILSYWCFSPGYSMKDLENQGVRCIILTSGTLSPLNSFTSEMRIKFQVSLENSHVIERDQIFVSVIEQGPDRVQLSSAYDRRFLPENLSSLGNTVVNLTRVVPHGLLLFFPSFYLMEKTLEFWREHGHADRIESVKPMFIEQKGKGAFTETIGAYYNKVSDSQSRGGIFAAVCRGKASEGLDFANTYGRGVIITGLPFPPKMDPRVILKMQFLDEMNRKKLGGEKFLTGQEWYREQAFRAVNQAIGRVIRHKDDYGAIFLCDQRFKSKDVQSHLPSWLKPYVRSYDNFGNIVRDVCQFFRVAQKMRPVLEKNPATDQLLCPASSSELSVPHCSGATQKPCTQKAKIVEMHTSTLKRRRTDEDIEYASIFKQYESPSQKSKMKPGSLFDALERVEQRRRNDALGEEMQSNWSTLSLQYDKKMDEMMRGGKRKINLVPEQPSVSVVVTGNGKNSIAKTFLGEMKSSLSQVNFEKIRQALYTYKKDDNLDQLLLNTSLLTDDPHTYRLLRGLYPFVRPHHRKIFDEKCLEQTGTGCGYKAEHSVYTDEKKARMPPSAEQTSELSSSKSDLPSSTHFDVEQSKQGGHQGLQENQTGADSKTQVQTAFLADVKKGLGPEGSAQLFKAVNDYKKTDNYDNMVAAAVALFTEKDENFSLLVRFGSVIRPHHKKQYKEMLSALMGQSADTVPAQMDQTKIEERQSSA
ncbi:regulator of telomere elongation helicase 1 isoform X2 [Corythoichthys intestinalis]|uniref:regulator of telomere elongation helicase 1 isoform X2 n=1 Tax=Corythoichthys intestinalis TaxID=161448 RepID=UPI0025A593B6|nr:regulator of telomere elongation helicase 1 isoform X2 [Corythoichthys intestinalis]